MAYFCPLDQEEGARTVINNHSVVAHNTANC